MSRTYTPQHASIVLLKAKGNQGLSTTRQQQSVCVRLIKGAFLDADGGEVQTEGPQGP